MSHGKLRPDKALAAAHRWVHRTLMVGLRRDYPGPQLAAAFNDAALEQIKGVVGAIASMYDPAPPPPPPDDE